MKFCSCLLFFCAVMSYGQPGSSLTIPQIDMEPTLDHFTGMKPSPEVGGKMAMTTGFIQRDPADGKPASYKTEVYSAWDQRFLYFIFLAFDDEPDKIRARMSPREQVFNDDFVDVQLDTFNDQRRAYTFLSTPQGIQWDAQWTEGRDFDDSYDALWFSEGRLTDQGYMVLIKVPFNILRFPRTGEQTWRIMYNRSIPRLSEESYWPHYSNEIEGRLNQAAELKGIRDVSPGRNIQLVPYGFARSFDILDPDLPGFVSDDFDPEVGLDAKMVIKDSFVLDITANPDFSQVESDQPQITVNRRFEVFFEENRPFFLENADLFQTPTNLVFTRRIVDPNAGLRFTGKKGNYNLGLMLLDDEAAGSGRDADDPLAGKAAEVGIFRLTRDLSNQSTVGLLYTHRGHGDNSNRVYSIDGRIKLNDNWVASLHGAGAETEEGDRSQSGTMYNISVNRSGRHLQVHNHFLRTSEDFRTRLGFLRGEGRPGVMNLHNQTTYVFRPEDSKLVSWQMSLRSEQLWDLEDEPVDTIFRPRLEWEWLGDTEVELGFDYVKQRLTPEEFPALPMDTEFTDRMWSIEFDSDYISTLSAGFDVEWGEGVNFESFDDSPPEIADILEASGSVTWRPLSQLSINTRYIYLKLDHKDGDEIFSNEIARSRWNWQFTRELSLRVIFEYNKTDPNPLRTNLERRERMNNDLLLRYVLNPWTAFYLGYNGNQSNFDLVDGEDGPVYLRTPDGLKTDGRQYFFKCTWLFSF